MKTQPLQVAELDFGPSPDDPPRSRLSGDLYHPGIGAAAQARHVFLQGNDLPARWEGCGDFTVLETGFGLGHNFLATWQAWKTWNTGQRDPQSDKRLHFVSLERHPVRRQDLARVHASSPWPELAAALLAAWPPLTPGLHTLDFEQGRVRLLLALGDAAALLPALRLRADAFFLAGFAPSRNPEMWQPGLLKSLGRLAATDATAASWSVAHALHAGLRTAGFEPRIAPGIGGKREITTARFSPRFVPRRLPDAAVATRHAVVVGAGLAGAAAAQALARLGLAVTVLEGAAQPASQASGNPAGLFHGTVSADDGLYARLFRAAALAAGTAYAAAVQAGVPGSAAGLLRLATPGDSWPAMSDRLWRLGLPPDCVQALDAEAATAMAGVPLAAPAWFYPGGGWLSPPDWVRHALASPGVTLRCNSPAAALRRHGPDWCLFDAQGACLARAPLVVLALSEGVAPLLRDLPAPPWPLHRTRGQVTHWRGSSAGPATLRLPVAGDGYAIPLPDGGLLCGATRQEDDPDPQVREADHRHNLQRLQRLIGVDCLHGVGGLDAQHSLHDGSDSSGQTTAADAADAAGAAGAAGAGAPQASGAAVAAPRLQGRVGWRLHAADRLPIAGPLPIWPLPQGQRADQVRLLPRHPGLFVLTALGARGLTLAPLLARLVAAQATGTPWPLEQDLADAVDPARWAVRQARMAQGAGGGPQRG